MAQFATQVFGCSNKGLIDPEVIEQCAHGVQKRIWREEYRLKKEKALPSQNYIKGKIMRLRIIRDELQTILEIL